MIPIPCINENEILVKMASAGLCHSDLMLFEGSLISNGVVTMGHEGVGFVEKLGSKVKGFKPGDRIGFLYIKGVCCTSILRRRQSKHLITVSSRMRRLPSS